MILKGVTMDVREGEIMVIMGGSGSGKSTLLRHLMALETATSGTMRILGKDIATNWACARFYWPCAGSWASPSRAARCSAR